MSTTAAVEELGMAEERPAASSLDLEPRRGQVVFAVSFTVVAELMWLALIAYAVYRLV